jgi:malonyl-CoA O-methyltransferase
MQLMEISIHSRAVSRNFSMAAMSYDQWAAPQLSIARNLISLLPGNVCIESILDVGCGTGYLTGLLHEHYPEACILGIDIAPEMANICRRRWEKTRRLSFLVADAESFNSRTCFDLVASSFCFQWFSAREQSIGRMTGMLNPGGIFACAMPVAGSLAELYETYQSVLSERMPGLEYESSGIYVDTLARAGLNIVHFEEATIQGLYKSGLNALRAFKGIGATFKHYRGYTPRSAAEVKKIAEHYERCHALADGQVPITYNVLYVVAESVP